MNIKNLFKKKIEIVRFKDGKYGARKRDLWPGWVFVSRYKNFVTLDGKEPYSWQQFESVDEVKSALKKQLENPDIGEVVEVLYI